MSRKNEKEQKDLIIKTLFFLIKERNIALFRLHSYRFANKLFERDYRSVIVEQENIVKNLRRRIIREIISNENILTEEEKGLFVRKSTKRGE